MMKNDYTDKILYNYYKQIEPPISIKNITNNPPKESMYKKKKYVWKISTVCAILLMICTITFGKSIYMYILDAIAKVHEGVGTAVNNNYYSEINMEYVESNNTSIKVEYVLMDDFNLFLAFDVRKKFDTMIHNLKFKDMIITDENNNLIFCDDVSTYEKYCKENGIEITSIPRSSYTDDGYGIENIEQNENNVKTLYKLYSSKYPKCKVLNIEIHTMEINTKEDTKNIEGAWKIKINLPEEFYNREYVYYHMKENIDKENYINIESVIVSNTQTVVKYNGKLNEYENSIEGVEGKINDILNSEGSFYDNMWIENEKREKFEISVINDGYGTLYSPDGSYKGEMPFDLTKYDLTDKLYLIIEKNDKEYKINLER